MPADRPELLFPAAIVAQLEQRLGKVHARQRIGIELEHHQQVFSLHGKIFHLENWYSFSSWIRACLKLTGLHQRAQSNTTRIQIRHNQFSLPALPAAFDGYRILHLSDLHLDMYAPAAHALIEAVRKVDYDACVITGDFRARTFGDITPTLDTLAQLRNHLPDPVFAVLGNHDSIAMLPAMEAMGIRLLLNENVLLEKGGQSLRLAGIDDAHFFHVDNIQQALTGNEQAAITLLLSHTPEVYRQAAHAGVDLFLCGHTHGGQICLPGGIPLTLDSRCPRRLGRGYWRTGQMQGYTSVGAGSSVVDLRLNCLPEITLHHLTTAAA